MTCPMRSGEPHSYDGIRTDRCYYCSTPRPERVSREAAGAPIASEESLATGIGLKRRDKQKKKNGLDPAGKQEVQTVNDTP